MDGMYICVYVAMGSICVFVGMNGVWCPHVYAVHVYVFIVCRWDVHVCGVHVYMYSLCVGGVYMEYLCSFDYIYTYICMYVMNGVCVWCMWI